MVSSWTMLATLLSALLTFAPKYLDVDIASAHVRAALAAEHETGVDAHLLLAVGYIESRYDRRTLSRWECTGKVCHRVRGSWPHVDPPANAHPDWYCGVMQVGGNVPWSTCQRLRFDLDRNYLVGARHLLWWMGVPECRDLSAREQRDCALRGYNGGYPAIRRKSQKYVNMVLWAEWQIRHARKP
jgi:hypothetical protein